MPAAWAGKSISTRVGIVPWEVLPSRQLHEGIAQPAFMFWYWKCAGLELSSPSAQSWDDILSSTKLPLASFPSNT